MNISRALVKGALRRVQGGRIDVVENGTRESFGRADAELKATIEIHDSAAWRSFMGGSHRLAETFMAHAWDCDDLVSLVRIGARDLPRLDRMRRALLPVRRLIDRVPRNTIRASRRHIAGHYDLGNDLFAAFLDETMTYSCAAFDTPEVGLREAQEAKLERVCRKLELTPEDHLLEIGTGWGSLAIHAAKHFGCRVTTTTISRRQHDLATVRVADAGVSDRVEILFEDYRHLSGIYSKLASIEMIEAVGWQYFDLFFRRCSELLEPDGLMLLQAITIEDDRYDLEKATRSFINTYVFPAGCLPSLHVIRDCMSRTGLAELDLEDLSASYPLTLRAWRERFLAVREDVRAKGYDERFVRLWELYLSWCEGGFREGRIQDYQVLARRQPASTTDRMLPDGSVNQAMSGPGPRKTPSSSASTSVPS